MVSRQRQPTFYINTNTHSLWKKYYYYIDKNGEKVYTWDPNATDDMPARKSLRAKGNDWIKETEYGQLFFDMEKRMEQIAR